MRHRGCLRQLGLLFQVLGVLAVGVLALVPAAAQAQGAIEAWVPRYTGPTAFTDLGAPDGGRRFYRAVTP